MVCETMRYENSLKKRRINFLLKALTFIRFFEWHVAYKFFLFWFFSLDKLYFKK